MSANGPILVTGASGFLGTHLVERLVQAGATVVGTSRRVRAMPSGAVSTEAIDLRDGPGVARLFQKWNFSEVYHFAAAGARSDERDVSEIVAANAVGAANLARAAIGCGVSRFVYMGTGYEYAAQDRPSDESATLRPLNLYGAAKAAAYGILDYFFRVEGLPLITLRAFAAYGPGEMLPRLIPFVCSQVLQDLPVALTSGTQVRDYLYAGDLMDAVMAARERAVAGSVYNLGGGPAHAVTVRTLVETIVELAGRPLTLCRFGAAPARRLEPAFLVADISKAERELGWRPATSLEDGLRLTLQWNTALVRNATRGAA